MGMCRCGDVQMWGCGDIIKNSKVNMEADKKIEDNLILKLSFEFAIKVIAYTEKLESLRKYNKKLKDQMKDMHYKASLKLVKEYDNIHIGKLSTKSILSKKNTKISSTSKRMLQAFSPYTFTQRLMHTGNLCNETT